MDFGIYCLATYTGPMAGTIGDFWKMVWEQKSSVIVMLTKLEEGGKVWSFSYVHMHVTYIFF